MTISTLSAEDWLAVPPAAKKELERLRNLPVQEITDAFFAQTETNGFRIITFDVRNYSASDDGKITFSISILHVLTRMKFSMDHTGYLIP